jgi:hypothetical protein
VSIASSEAHVEVFAFVGIPFLVLLLAFALVGNAIGGNAAGPGTDQEPSAPVTAGMRLRPAAVILAASGLAAAGAWAAAAGGAFASLTDQGYAIEPAALVFAIEAIAGIALAGLVALAGLSARRAWILRTVGLCWLCAAAPVLILSDTGAGWVSLVDQRGLLPLGLSPFPIELVAAVAPAVLVWIASLRLRQN